MNLEKLYRSIYLNLKRKSENLGIGEHKDLQRYRRNQNKFLKRKIKLSSETKLLNSCLKSEVIYLGDFHTFDQSTKNLERILKYLITKKQKFSIGLELVHSSHQLYIESYLANELSDLEFLETIQYHDSWRFPWNHYRLIFEWAKKYKIPIIGLNSKGSLDSRDKHASQIITQNLKAFPKSKMLVLFGEYHIFPDKLPAIVQKTANRKLSETIIHQNTEELFFKIQKLKKDGTIIEFSPTEFHLQTSPPWVKYESYVYWFEHIMEDSEFDLHRYIIQTGLKSYQTNYLDQFRLIFDVINKNLKLGLNPKLVDDVELWDQTQIEKTKKYILKIKDEKLRGYYHFLLEQHQTFLIPQTSIIYCPNYSLNRLSYAAGIYLFEIILKNQELDRSLLLKESNDLKFMFLLKQSFMGFLVSKIINPMRKCDLYQDLQLSKNNKSNQYALKILDQKKLIKLNQLSLIHLTAKTVGHLLAHYYFNRFAKDLEQELKNLDFYLYFSKNPQDDYSLLERNILKGIKINKEKKKRF